MSENAKLTHTDDLRDQAAVDAAGNPLVPPEEGRSAITRDAGDLGVPMMQGSPDKPVGPEDALDPGPKQGDYSGRMGGSSYSPHVGREAQRP